MFDRDGEGSMRSVVQKPVLVIPYVAVIQYSERRGGGGRGAGQPGPDGGSGLNKKGNDSRKMGVSPNERGVGVKEKTSRWQSKKERRYKRKRQRQ